MVSPEPLAYAIDPPEVSAGRDVGVQLVVTNRTEESVSNLCLEVSSNSDWLQVLGDHAFSGIILPPNGSIHLPLRLRGRPGTGKLRLHSVSLRLNGRSERLSEVQLSLPVTAPPVAPPVLSGSAQREARAHIRRQPLSVFISYAHEDEQIRSKLVGHLKLLERLDFIRHWDDRKILPGSAFGTEVDKQLDCADIILLLVSPDFLNSEYCYENEMARALRRHELGEARVIPIIVRPVDWESAPFRMLNVLPTEGRPIVMWDNQDAAFVDIVKGIRSVIECQQRTI